jgi:hypothetical protein
VTGAHADIQKPESNRSGGHNSGLGPGSPYRGDLIDSRSQMLAASCLGRRRKSFATSPGYLRTVRATWSTRPRYLRRALAEEPAQPAETPAEVVDHEAASSSLPWHRLDPGDIPPEPREPS